MAKNISQMANICDTDAVVKEESEVGDEYHNMVYYTRHIYYRSNAPEYIQ